MKEIENVLICGLGAIGTIYADIINKYSPDNLKILVDAERFDRYSKNPTVFNGKILELNYVLPSDNTFKADLIIIATKSYNLDEVIKNIKNFIYKDTLIISLINGITSEHRIADVYGKERLVYSYFIGHSSIRNGREITQDGVHKIVFGSHHLIDNVKRIKEYFDKVGINYEIPDDIKYSCYLKYMLNVSCNQVSAATHKTFGEMFESPTSMDMIKQAMSEVQQMAHADDVLHYENLMNDALEILKTMSPNGKTSMLQDVEAGRKTEIDIFADEVIKWGKRFNFSTQMNEDFRELITLTK